MNVALAISNKDGPFGELFAAARGRLPGAGAVAEARQAAFDDFASRGLPHRRIEEWKYTDLRVLLRNIAPLAAAPDKAALRRAAETVKALAIRGSQKLVLVDGVFAADLSDVGASTAGIRVQTLREALEAGAATAELLRTASLGTASASDAMMSLNAAMATDGVVI